MDFVSHALTGRLIASFNQKRIRFSTWVITAAAILPDIPVIFVYLLLGHSRGRPFWIPFNSDWIGVRAAHPWWSALWEIPHSFLFLFIILIPIILYFRLPKLSIAAYGLHLVLDLFTHSGEWAMKPLYPLPWTIEGFTNTWAWPLLSMVVAWTILISLIIVSEIIKRRRLVHQNIRK